MTASQRHQFFKARLRPYPDKQLQEELMREAQRLARTEEKGKLTLSKDRRELKRSEDNIKEEERLIESLRSEAEEAKAAAKAERDGVERERGEILNGFQEVRTALEVRGVRVAREEARRVWTRPMRERGVVLKGKVLFHEE